MSWEEWDWFWTAVGYFHVPRLQPTAGASKSPLVITAPYYCKTMDQVALSSNIGPYPNMFPGETSSFSHQAVSHYPWVSILLFLFLFHFSTSFLSILVASRFSMSAVLSRVLCSANALWQWIGVLLSRLFPHPRPAGLQTGGNLILCPFLDPVVPAWWLSWDHTLPGLSKWPLMSVICVGLTPARGPASQFPTCPGSPSSPAWCQTGIMFAFFREY